MSRSLSSVAIVALAAISRAQCPDAWTLVANGGPPAGESPSMVFDAQHGVCVLFVAGETWEWNGLAWQLVAPAQPPVQPSPRTNQALAYDPVRGRVVLFGGKDGANVLGDTWEWDGTAWTLAATSGPPARWGHAIAFHGPTSRCVLYGGIDASDTILGDTWAWDGASWTSQAVSTSPGPRALHSMGRSATGIGRALLFGGASGGDSNGELWRLGASGWALEYPCAVFPRSEAPFVHDSARQRLVLFGGLDYDVILDGTTYASHSGEFKAFALTGPSPRRAAALAYDSLRDRVVLFGGVTANGPSAETWELRSIGSPGAPANVSAGEARKGVVALSWFDGTPAGTGSLVERDRWTGLTWSNVAIAAAQNPSIGRLYDVPGAGMWRYRVQASSCAGSSPWSASVVVLPAAPSGIAVTRQGSSAVVRWTDESDFEAGFEVQRERRLGFGWGHTTTVANPPANATSIMNGVGSGQWRYRVRAHNVGGTSAWTSWFVIGV